MQLTVKNMIGETVFAIEVDVMQVVMTKVLEEMEEKKIVMKGSSTLSETEIKGDLLVLSNPIVKKDKNHVKPKRPINAFMRFHLDHYHEIKQEVFTDEKFANANGCEIRNESNQRLRILWMNASEDIKTKYLQECEDNRIKYLKSIINNKFKKKKNIICKTY